MWNLKDNDAWAAGIIEGEGYIYKRLAKGCVNYYSCGIRVNMTDRDIVERLHKHFGGKFYILAKRGNYKQAYEWSAAKQELVYDILLRIRPYMGKRRKERIDEILDWMHNNSPIIRKYLE